MNFNNTLLSSFLLSVAVLSTSAQAQAQVSPENCERQFQVCDTILAQCDDGDQVCYDRVDRCFEGIDLSCASEDGFEDAELAISPECERQFKICDDIAAQCSDEDQACWDRAQACDEGLDDACFTGEEVEETVPEVSPECERQFVACDEIVAQCSDEDQACWERADECYTNVDVSCFEHGEALPEVDDATLAKLEVCETEIDACFEASLPQGPDSELEDAFKVDEDTEVKFAECEATYETCVNAAWPQGAL